MGTVSIPNDFGWKSVAWALGTSAIDSGTLRQALPDLRHWVGGPVLSKPAQVRGAIALRSHLRYILRRWIQAHSGWIKTCKTTGTIRSWGKSSVQFPWTICIGPSRKGDWA